jgi:hypothetical protein
MITTAEAVSLWDVQGIGLAFPGTSVTYTVPKGKQLVIRRIAFISQTGLQTDAYVDVYPASSPPGGTERRIGLIRAANTIPMYFTTLEGLVVPAEYVVKLGLTGASSKLIVAGSGMLVTQR